MQAMVNLNGKGSSTTGWSGSQLDAILHARVVRDADPELFEQVKRGEVLPKTAEKAVKKKQRAKRIVVCRSRSRATKAPGPGKFTPCRLFDSLGQSEAVH